MIRINAHYGISEFNETKKKTAARREPFKIVQDLIFNFKKSPCRAWSPYCGASGKPQTQWGTFISRELINKAAIQPESAETDVEESRIIRYPPQISFASLEEAGIVHSYGAFLEWKREKEVYDNISTMDHKVGFLNLANQGIMDTMFYRMPGTKIVESFRVKEASSVVISFTSLSILWSIFEMLS